MPAIRRILCPVDFSEHSRAALLHGEFFARHFDADLILAHVVEPVPYPVAYGLPASAAPANLEDAALRAAEQALEKLATEVRAPGLRVRAAIDTGIPSLRICALVEELEIDLVVMATHGLTGLKHMLLGSTTERVVRRSSCPVLTVKVEPQHDG